jgi:hypothetical protein
VITKYSPITKMQAFTRSAVRRPRLLASAPPSTAPRGPPTAKADTARDHSNVVWPGNTTVSSAFITPVLYPLRNSPTIEAKTAAIRENVICAVPPQQQLRVFCVAFSACKSTSSLIIPFPASAISGSSTCTSIESLVMQCRSIETDL